MLILRRFVGNEYALAGIHCHIWGRQSIGIRDEQGPNAVVVDGQFLNPLAINPFGLVYLNALDQLIEHSGCQFLCPRVLANGGQEHVGGNRFTIALLSLILV